jgi:hypothetical protein
MNLLLGSIVITVPLVVAAPFYVILHRHAAKAIIKEA